MRKGEDLKIGIYKTIIDIVDIDCKVIVDAGEVINITSIEFDHLYACISQKCQINIHFQKFGIGEAMNPIVFYENNKQQAINTFFKVFKKIE